MSNAEATARTVYRDYNLGALPQDVKRHLMILMLSDNSYEEYESEMLVLCENPEMLTRQQINERVNEALLDINEGRVSSPEEMEHRIETKYPWLCK